MNTVSEKRVWLSVRQVAKRLGCHPNTVWRKLATGELGAVQLGGRGTSVRIAEDELERWLYSLPGGTLDAKERAA